jgi:hypothetical protein
MVPSADGGVFRTTDLVEDAPFPHANTGVTVNVEIPAPDGKVTPIVVEVLLPEALPKLQM